jgi:simple sugar transport system permease protein
MDTLARTIRSREFGPIAGLFIIAIAFHILSEGKFFTSEQLASVAAVAAAVGTIAVGVALLMIAGEFDLSVGAMYAFIPIVMGKLVVESGWAEPVAFVLVMAIAAAVGLVHGVIVTRLHIPSFITTLGTLFVLTGLNFVITGGYPVDNPHRGVIFDALGRDIGGTSFSMPFVWLIVVAAAVWFSLTRTRFGNWVYASGGRLNAARAMGVPEARVKTTCFVVCSMLAGFAGVAQFAQITSISAGFGQDYNLLAIVAAVLGGTSLFGVTGSIVGATVGALVLASLQTGLVLAGAPGSWYTSIIGVVLIAAVAINLRLEKVRFGITVERGGATRGAASTAASATRSGA